MSSSSSTGCDKGRTTVGRGAALDAAAEKAFTEEPAAKEPADDLAATSAAKTPAGAVMLMIKLQKRPPQRQSWWITSQLRSQQLKAPLRALRELSCP